MLYHPTCVGLGYGLYVGAISWHPITASSTTNRWKLLTGCVTSYRLTNINVIPIDYAFRPRLRGRLTLLRLTLSRKPWDFGDSDSHTVCRYSCQHSRFRYLQQTLRFTFADLRNAPLPRILRCILSFGIWFNPRYIFAARQLI